MRCCNIDTVSGAGEGRSQGDDCPALLLLPVACDSSVIPLFVFTQSANMETMERIWHNLFKRKKKKYAPPEAEARDDNEKENLSLSSKSDNEDLQKVTVKASGMRVDI